MSSATPGLPCATESAQGNEALWGTASRVRRWLLVEQPGPWGPEALTQSRLDRPIASALDAHGRRHGVRVVLLRRPGSLVTGARTVLMAHTDPHSSWMERLEVDRPDRLLALDLAALAAPQPPGVGAPVAAVNLVCTNGRHDRCCADFGRPVVRSLQAGGTEVWECSHIGGDRFAANLVSLPTGVYYGRVPPERAPQMVADLSRGILDLDHYRGRSCFTPLVQVAEICAREELGERRLGALRVVSSTPGGPDRLTVVLAHDSDAEVEVTVGRSRAQARQLTCAGEKEGRPWRYSLESICVRRRRRPGAEPPPG